MEIDRKRNSSLKFHWFSPSTLLFLILALGLVLRVLELGTESYWIDEMSTLIEGRQSIPQLFASGRLDQPPAYYLPFHFWIKSFGTSELGARSFSVLIGVCSIFLVFMVGRLLFGNSVGLISAFFMAVSQFQIYHSQIARFFGFFEFTTLLSYLFLVLVLKERRMVYLALYVLSSIAMLYSHAFGLFVLAGQNLFFLLQIRRHARDVPVWLFSQFLVLLAFIPYFYPLMFVGNQMDGAVSNNIGNVPVPSLTDPLRSVYIFLLSARRDRGWETILLDYAVAGIFLVMMIAIDRFWLRKKRPADARQGMAELFQTQDSRSSLVLTACWLVCPILLPFLLSLWVIPIYKDYYTISAAPAAYLLLAGVIFSARKLVPLAVSLGTFLIMVIPGLAYYYHENINEQWKEVATFIEENSRPNDVIVFAPNEGSRNIQQTTFDWYYEGPLNGCSLTKDESAMWENLIQCTSGHDRFWVVTNGTSETVDLFQTFFLKNVNDRLLLLDEERFTRIYVYLFETK